MPFPPSKANNFTQPQSPSGFNTSYQQARNAMTAREYKRKLKQLRAGR